MKIKEIIQIFLVFIAFEFLMNLPFILILLFIMRYKMNSSWEYAVISSVIGGWICGQAIYGIIDLFLPDKKRLRKKRYAKRQKI
ncbi:MAG TPA: hypothetical protein DER01_00825 [Phycisphaerales bacterium]|nr:hypothetical protein [Phycisphaerales bacterium]